MDTAYLSEIRGYLDREGRLTQFPTKRRKKIIALCFLAERIPVGQTYSERDFNALLNTLHTFGDPATLRRELYDFCQINRNPDGSGYALNPDRPSAEALIERYCR